ncbi:DUF4245 domain-containing protein [Nakamurella leprariae]|uniref:DUF4245 domain-containing protein n=1 Tax=Nakamurella leprariae TaxID=2803911 RepID=A0A938Y942_9ACTN|nr:DUF4245 domain-containing protein [Nakamurella leprariae]MBM9468316.1 DUF4245 domain-containing protein [Nakamurella leprariae]
MARRRTSTGRDMTLSMGLLVIVVLLAAWLAGTVDFAPGGPKDGPAPTADVVGGLARADASTGFDVVTPDGVPGDWQPSAFSVIEAGSVEPPAARAAWITPAGSFITLIQAQGDTARVLAAELDDDPSDARSRTASGVRAVDGRDWTVTTGRRGEAAWYLTTPATDSADQVVLLITGSATPDDFTALAAATGRAIGVPTS